MRSCVSIYVHFYAYMCYGSHFTPPIYTLKYPPGDAQDGWLLISMRLNLPKEYGKVEKTGEYGLYQSIF